MFVQDGQWVAFFDDDQFASPRWLLSLFEAAEFTGDRIVGGPVMLAVASEELDALGPGIAKRFAKRTCIPNCIPTSKANHQARATRWWHAVSSTSWGCSTNRSMAVDRIMTFSAALAGPVWHSGTLRRPSFAIVLTTSG